jgi:crotonobetainyl-CoA:carnitine CoA-transferase CaiB-like acyl-CoA transferase
MTPAASTSAEGSFEEPAIEAPPSAGPLAGIRVLDLTSVVLGPLATQVLGDYGAEIIKVEGPGGDMIRANGVSIHSGMSSIFLALNRNKRSLCIDLRAKQGAAILGRLIPTADVLVHNMRMGAIERLGFGYEAVAHLNPRIIYCVATGFDQEGPDRDKPAFDDVIQAASGLAAMVGVGRGEPGFVPTLVADKTTGLAVVNAILAALLCREKAGSGQFVEVPMLETFTAFMLAEHLGGLTFAPSPAPPGYARLLEGGRRPLRTKDGYVAMLPYSGEHWVALFQAIDRLDLIEKFKVTDQEERNANVTALYAVLETVTAQRSTSEWMTLCNQLDIPASPIYSLGELSEHPQLKSVKLFQMMMHPTEGETRYVRPTAKFSKTPAKVRRPAPCLGQHSRELLREANYGDAEIEALITQRVVFQHQEST